MQGINGNYSFSYSFSQTSSYSYSSDGMNEQETFETSSHSEIAYESNDKKEPLNFSMRSKSQDRIGNDVQEHNHAKRGGRKPHDHNHNHRLGFDQGKDTERAMKMVEKALEQSFAALEAKMHTGLDSNPVNSQYGTSPVSTYVQIADEKPTAEKVSGNIVGFIAHKTAQVAAEGGSQADIENTLDQGVAEFKQGFGEAKEQIEALGLLDKDVNADIGQTFDLVLADIEEIKVQYLDENSETVVEDTSLVADDLAGLHVEKVDGDVPAVIPATNEAENAVDKASIETLSSNEVVEEENEDSSIPLNITEDIINDPVADLAIGMQGLQRLSYASYDALDFQLVTQDGDVVTLNFSDVEANAQQFNFAEGFANYDLNSAENLSNSFYKNTEFSIDVEGELDSDELQAIRDLMNQVIKLAGDFFAGNPQNAFEQAMDMGFDASEIAQYSFNMTSIEVMKIENSYGAIANMNPVLDDSDTVASVQESVNPLKDLNGYIKGLLDAMNKSQDFGDPKFIADAMRSIESTSQLEIINDGKTHSINGFTDFNEKLLENLS